MRSYVHSYRVLARCLAIIGAALLTVAPTAVRAQEVDAPFELSDEELTAVKAVLEQWGKHNQQIKLAKATFTLKTDDPIFRKHSEVAGSLSCKAPDQAVYIVQNGAGQPTEHWLFNGKALFDFDHTLLKLTQVDIPPEAKDRFPHFGLGLTLFAADQTKLIDRYWVRLVPPPADKATEQFWIEFYPRHKTDWTGFQRARIILTRSEFLPVAMEFYFENKGQSVHQYSAWQINDAVDSMDSILQRDEFDVTTPTGWTRLDLDW